MLGGQAAQSFTDVFASMSRPGSQGMEQWIAQVQPFLRMLQSMQGPADAQAWMGLPTFGFAREHQARWQQLALAQIDHQDTSRAFAELMNEAAQQAFVVFERKLGERTAPGRQVESTRALFDLWVDAAEEAYAEIALSPRFRETYGALVDAQMRLRAAVQREVEVMGEMVGMPTRTEVDAAHRKTVQLEREVRRLRDAVEALRADKGSGAAGSRGAKPSSTDYGDANEATGGAASKTTAHKSTASKTAKRAGRAAEAGPSADANEGGKRKPAAGPTKTKKAR